MEEKGGVVEWGPVGRTGTSRAVGVGDRVQIGRADWFGFHPNENSKRVSSIRFCALVGAGSRGPDVTHDESIIQGIMSFSLLSKEKFALKRI
jgi:hypothetical protein